MSGVQLQMLLKPLDFRMMMGLLDYKNTLYTDFLSPLMLEAFVNWDDVVKNQWLNFL